MKYKDLIKNNTKFIIAMNIVIILGIIGITFAITYNTSVGIYIKTAELEANITYLDGSSSSISNTGNLIPINDVSTIIDATTTNSNVLKISFKVTGASTNPNNTIMDISLNDIDIDCELKSEYFKWKLYKNNALLNSGSFSLSFDTLQNNRLVLTDTQQDLKSTTDTYVLIIYISESCTGDISSCDSNYDQENLSGKRFNATLKLELSTGTKKTNERNTSTANACTYTSVSIPTCNTSLTYSGSTQTLVDAGTGYTLTNNTGVSAGNYAVVAKLDSGYIWSDNTKEDKIINCIIARKNLTITAKNQTISKGSSLNNNISYINISGLASGDTISSINLYTPQYEVGTGVIYASAAIITNASDKDVTVNYNINYINGTITIN